MSFLSISPVQSEAIRRPAAEAEMQPGANSPVSQAGSGATGRVDFASFLRGLIRLPAHVLLLLIRLYQRTLSPALPLIFGSACGCRFSPSCSHYAAEAIRTHGALAGVVLAAIRLVKCTPLHPGGFDAVPTRRRSRPRCERAAV